MSRLTRLRLVATLLIMAAMRASPWAEEPASQVASNLLAEFPIFNDGDALLIPVIIGEKTCSFMIDTGASKTVFDSRLRSSLMSPENAGDKTVQISGAGTLEQAWAREFSVCGLKRFWLHRVWVKDFSDIRAASGHEICGIMGMDILGGYVLRIDADRSLLQFFKHAPESDGVSIPMGSTARVSTVRLSFAPDLAGEFLVDTGCTSIRDRLSLNLKMYRELERRGLLKTRQSASFAKLGGEFRTKLGELRQASLIDGPTLENVRIHEGKGGHDLLGLNLLLDYNAILDFRTDRLILETRKQAHTCAFTTTDCGVGLMRLDDGSTAVHDIEQKSRADAAGLFVNDFIESVDVLVRSSTGIFLADFV